MTAMLQQAIKLLPLARMELVHLIRQELASNPLLEDQDVLQDSEEEVVREEGVDDLPSDPSAEAEIDWDRMLRDEDADIPSSGKVDEASSKGDFSSLSSKGSLMEYLTSQLCSTVRTMQDKAIGALIIGHLNQAGYLESDIDELAELAGSEKEHVEQVLRTVQSFDPPGVAARSLQECLLLQLHHFGLQGTLAETLVCRYLYMLEEKNYGQIARELRVSVEELVNGVKLIKRLNPQPGLRFLADETQYLVPDVSVIKLSDASGDYEVILNDDGMPMLRISPFYKAYLRERSDIHDPVKQYVVEHYRSALWLIKGIEMRKRTLYKVSSSIVKFQRAFLDKGVHYLRPLVLREVAEDIGMHESTVSRVTSNKYISTPQGVFELKHFFHGGVVSENGEALSSLSIKDMIKRMVSEENNKNPLTDQEIVEALRSKGIVIARRTVTKYRREANIFSSHERRSLFGY